MRLLIWKPVACIKWAIFLGNRGCVAVASFFNVPLALRCRIAEFTICNHCVIAEGEMVSAVDKTS
jgi:hypothetical protein